MRITTNMLNQAAVKRGATKQTTLLDILNEKSSKNMFTSSISGTNASNALRKSNYEKMTEYCEQMMKDTEKLADPSKNSLFTKAESENSTKDVVSTVKSVVKNYNAIYDQVKGSGDNLDQFYKKQLSTLATQNKDSLKEVGITIASDGKLLVDEKVLASASRSDLKKAFGNNAPFTTKLNALSGRINDNASAMLGSMSNQYSSTGRTYNSNTNTGKYNFFS